MFILIPSCFRLGIQTFTHAHTHARTQARTKTLTRIHTTLYIYIYILYVYLTLDGRYYGHFGLAVTTISLRILRAVYEFLGRL